MIRVRKASERGSSNSDWLDSKHSFSFAEYYDPEHMGFGPLRVINEDVIDPGKGFGSHPHRDMEIITYIIEGALEHKDSMGTCEVIRKGELQRMSAGTGVVHSEFNHSASEPVHLLQIWIRPEKSGIQPGYEQKQIELGKNSWKILAGPEVSESSLCIHQNVVLLGSSIDAGQSLAVPLHCWLQVVKGHARIGDLEIQYGDGVAVSNESELSLTALELTEVLLFDMSKLY
ncbi:MAG: pirin family protein [Candidatus Obscuribacterales bacterium]|nr:pirin family protein [Candidatus Obscuribacterales bacterium]